MLKISVGWFFSTTNNGTSNGTLKYLTTKPRGLNFVKAEQQNSLNPDHNKTKNQYISIITFLLLLKTLFMTPSFFVNT